MKDIHVRFTLVPIGMSAERFAERNLPALLNRCGEHNWVYRLNLTADFYWPCTHENLADAGVEWAELVKQLLKIADPYKIVYTVSAVTITPVAEGEFE